MILNLGKEKAMAKLYKRQKSEGIHTRFAVHSVHSLFFCWKNITFFRGGQGLVFCVFDNLVLIIAHFDTVFLGQLQVPGHCERIEGTSGRPLSADNNFEMSPLLTSQPDMKDSIITLDYVSSSVSATT